MEACFPSRCLVCRVEGKYFCEKHKEFSVAPFDKANLKFLDRVFAAVAYYDLNSKKAIEYFKFHGFKDLAEIMVMEILKNAPSGFFDNTILVPIPLHWTRKIWRGFNQADVLTEEIAKLVPSVHICRNLKRVRRTRQQARLSKRERLKNLKGAFVWDGERFSGNEKVILVDDVVASGATLDCAAEILKRYGVRNVEAVVFARGGRTNL